MSREAAIAAAERVLRDRTRMTNQEYRDLATSVIDAAAPHLALVLKAEVLREAADRVLQTGGHHLLRAGWRVYLHEEADRIERGGA